MPNFFDPNGLQEIDSTQTLQSAAVATGNGTNMAVRSQEGAILNVSGITTATIIVEGTPDNVTWSTLTVKDANAGNSLTSITANGFYTVEFIGLLNIRARISAYTSGTITVTGNVAQVEIQGGAIAPASQFSTIVASSSGATTIVAAVAGKKIQVLQWNLVCNAAVNVKWQSHVTPTDITGLHYFGVNGGIASPFCPVGLFQTIAGEALDINLSGAVAVGGSLVYVTI